MLLAALHGKCASKLLYVHFWIDGKFQTHSLVYNMNFIIGLYRFVRIFSIRHWYQDVIIGVLSYCRYVSTQKKEDVHVWMWLGASLSIISPRYETGASGLLKQKNLCTTGLTIFLFLWLRRVVRWHRASRRRSRLLEKWKTLAAKNIPVSIWDQGPNVETSLKLTALPEYTYSCRREEDL